MNRANENELLDPGVKAGYQGHNTQNTVNVVAVLKTICITEVSIET